MKKCFALGLSALLTILPLACQAEEAYCTITTLRAQAPAKWTQTCETKWRTVDIDAEILLPDVDAVPVMTVGYAQRKPLLTAEQSGWDTVEGRDDGSLLLYNDEISVPKKVDGKRINSMQEAKGAWYAGFAPENTYVPLCDVPSGKSAPKSTASLRALVIIRTITCWNAPAACGLSTGTTTVKSRTHCRGKSCSKPTRR
ncbi:MAG: hypothetical protein VB104_12435 [Candidatus Limiplasma sp.]|nr:hypothetical protein [Candidatus Limiplasma sp.]